MPYLGKEVQYQDISIKPLNIRNLARMDWWMPLLVLSLVVCGWVVMYSAARSSDMTYFYRQILFFFAGLILAALCVCIDYRFIVWLGPILYLVAIGVLLLVLMFGTVAKGSERWIDLHLFRLQPSEFSKLCMVFALTWYFNKLGARIKKLHWFLVSFMLVAIPMGLILKQPNLGTAASLAPLTLAMIYVAGCKRWHLAVVVILGLSVVPMVWWQMKDFDPKKEEEPRYFFELKHYQKMRIYTYLHPEYDPQGSGWHTLQSRITIGSGGLKGKGYLKGTQTRLNYLPEHHTDFIYSLLAEEFGFTGAITVIVLFTLLLLRGLTFAREAVDMSGTLLCTGIVVILAFHIFVNIAITSGLLPVTGIPLPFLSYGGNFYLTTMVGIGVLLSVPQRNYNDLLEEMRAPIGHIESFTRNA
ncbi:MAG: Rod shape-determining protein RodA [Candidatus Hydrogenedentes bacterium ADurb.Bin101]|mgnify:CR=1 FL=1|jgi:rod shape determining protein RodA|nr:MAG: Rod shape-determining protein RodA [Candidatus Hydrogenedentes bacterium ADurb.Bin101]HOC68425.1 rod shape-determining protein RodA [Candidatus Hydrogenedentota bacterium]